MPRVSLYNSEGRLTVDITPRSQPEPQPDNNKRHHQKAAFAAMNALEQPLRDARVTAEHAWETIKARYGVASRSELTEKQWCVIAARLNACKNFPILFKEFVQEIREFMTEVDTEIDLQSLASTYLKSPYIAAPQWDAEKKRWVCISPHGTSESSCGVVEFSGTPKTEADIKPHQRLMWQRCKQCNLIRPWGGCARNRV